jgi:hypothetical protein
MDRGEEIMKKLVKEMHENDIMYIHFYFYYKKQYDFTENEYANAVANLMLLNKALMN